MYQQSKDTPVVWTVICDFTDGGSRTWAFDTFLEAECAALLLRLEPDCNLVTVNYGPDWSSVTLFLYSPAEVPNDESIREPGSSG
jgi:hypothetical protein